MNPRDTNWLWVDVMADDELPVHIGRTVRCGGLEIALFRLASGKLHAVQNRCPHKAGVLAEGIVSGEYVFCPMHDRKIDLASGEVQKPDTGCVRVYATKIENGRIYIQVQESAAKAG
ncbi:nitrite reductase small subunit NirD [Paenibacillus thalictri]|uniref:Nitrite reductase small subunit NirD n=1 Tax=Paenibacillus thalictri TaxID=2527873 RepID=A0A4Q9DQG8_9BACL|nr:nitrite reductase small subunit NirD [Paenibacillus thalictri]TBL75653.1 nitrite reductase small subunit NirD [Paenibacillus thalictri]